MKTIFLTCCIVALAFISLSCTPQSTLEISVDENDNGVVIENVGSVDCMVFVKSGEGEQQFELAANETVTVTDISQPVEVSAVSLRDSASESSREE